LFDVEGLTDANAGIPHTIDKHVAARVEATYEKPVAKGKSAFSRPKRNAGR